MKLEITALGVGHGDALLIRWQGEEEHERWTCLVDGGSSPQTIRDHLREFGVNYLDLVVGTHPDSDHIGGLVGLADHLEKVDSYWAPPLPAFERHLWLFGDRCQGAIERCRSVEDTFDKLGAEVLYPVESYSSSPFGTSGPRIHVLSPAARLVRHLLTSDDVSWLFSSTVMPLGWILEDVGQEVIEEPLDVAVIDRALATGALRPEDISDRLRRGRPSRPEETELAKAWSARTDLDAEFFGDSVLNNTSIVCWLEVPTGLRSYRVLLPGDQENWTYLLARHPGGLNSEVLKAPHHGGRLFIEQDPAHDEVLSHIRPRVMIISANGNHGLPRTLVRNSAIRWGAAVVCTSEPTKESFMGPENKEECCYKGMSCDGSPSHNVTLTLDSSGIRGRRSCHPGVGSLPGPVIEIRQHIVSPSPVLDRLAGHELSRHINWVKKELRKIHKQRQVSTADMVPGSEPLDEDQLIPLAPAEYGPVLAAHLPTILAKGRERGVFWAQSDDAYRRARWCAYTVPTKEEVQRYLDRLGEKVMILFPDALDEIHRDPETVITKLETSVLADFADAVLHFPKVTFTRTLWPHVVKAFRSRTWHCYFFKKDVAFSQAVDEKQLLVHLVGAFYHEKELAGGEVGYEFDMQEWRLPFDGPVLFGSNSVGEHGAAIDRTTKQAFALFRSRIGIHAPVSIYTAISWISDIACQNDLVLEGDIIGTGWACDYSITRGYFELGRVSFFGLVNPFKRNFVDNSSAIRQSILEAIKQESPLSFTVHNPGLIALVKTEPKLAESIRLNSTYFRSAFFRRLW